MFPHGYLQICSLWNWCLHGFWGSWKQRPYTKPGACPYTERWRGLQCRSTLPTSGTCLLRRPTLLMDLCLSRAAIHVGKQGIISDQSCWLGMEWDRYTYKGVGKSNGKKRDWGHESWEWRKGRWPNTTSCSGSVVISATWTSVSWASLQLWWLTHPGIFTWSCPMGPWQMMRCAGSTYQYCRMMAFSSSGSQAGNAVQRYVGMGRYSTEWVLGGNNKILGFPSPAIKVYDWISLLPTDI